MSDDTAESACGPVVARADGVRVNVRLTPRGPADRIQGLATEADGSVVVKIAVTAPPEDGKANAALIDVLARACRLPKRDFEVVIGATSRRKTVHVAGDPQRLLALVRAACEKGRDEKGAVRDAAVTR